jgi:hypothetical protein
VVIKFFSNVFVGPGNNEILLPTLTVYKTDRKRKNAVQVWQPTIRASGGEDSTILRQTININPNFIDMSDLIILAPTMSFTGGKASFLEVDSSITVLTMQKAPGT